MQKKLLLIVVLGCVVVSIQAVEKEDIFTAARNNDVLLAKQCIKEYGVAVLEKTSSASGLAQDNKNDLSKWEGSIIVDVEYLKEMRAHHTSVEHFKKNCSNYGGIPLHTAAVCNSKEIIIFFLKQGGYKLLQERDLLDNTPLQAANYASRKVIDFLKENKQSRSKSVSYLNYLYRIAQVIEFLSKYEEKLLDTMQQDDVGRKD